MKLEELKKKYPQHDWNSKPYSLAVCKRCSCPELSPSAVCNSNWLEDLKKAQEERNKKRKK